MSTELQKAKTARANLMASLEYFDNLIKQLEPKEVKKPKRDYSAIEARVLSQSMKKFRKTA